MIALKTIRPIIFSNFSSLVLIKFILELAYIFFVSPNFSYEGYDFYFNINTYFLGWLLYFIGISIIFLKKNIFLYDFYILIFIFWFLPNIIIFSFLNKSIIDLLILILPFFAIVFFTSNTILFDLKKIRYGKPIVVFISIIMIVIVILNFSYSTGGNLNFDFSKVYEQREEYESKFGVGIFGYLNSWTYKVFSIVLLAWSLSKNKIGLVVFSVLLILMLFGFSGHKSSLTGLFIVPFFYFIYKYENSSDLFLKGVMVFLILSFIYILISDNLMYGSIVFRRLFMTPSFLNFTYIDFFSNNPHVYWSDSFSSLISGQKIYNLNLPYVVGNYLGSDELGANTGFIASGYAQAGLLGVFIYTFFCIIMMNLINTLALRNKKYLSMSLIIMPLSTLFISSDYLTTLSTHGLLLSILFLFLYEDRKYNLKFGNIKYEI